MNLREAHAARRGAVRELLYVLPKASHTSFALPHLARLAGASMNEITVLNLTNIALGLATLFLWGVIVVGIVEEVRDRRRNRLAREHRAPLRLVPPPRKAA